MDTPTSIELTKLLDALNSIHLALVAANEKLESLIEAETLQMAMAA